MARKTVFATALAAAFVAFAIAGGIQASEKAAIAVERQEQAPPAKHTIIPLLNSGKIRARAVLSGNKRVPSEVEDGQGPAAKG